MTAESPEDGAVEKVVDKILTLGVDGIGPLKGAKALADEQLIACGGDRELAVKRVIATHVRLVTATGFVTGLGGLIVLPVTLPTDVSTFYVLSSRCVAAVAHLRGYDIESDEARSVILLSIIGSAGSQVMKEMGVQAGTKAAFAALEKLPGKILIEINKRVGFRLITKFGEKGVINLVKFVPLAGGVAGGSVNLLSMRATGRWAKTNFPVSTPDQSE